MTELTNHRPIEQVLGREVASYSNDELIGFFYDWFCKDTSLPKKSKSLLKRLKSISPSWRFDPRKSYVFFKNNCPMSGRLYDDFRVCDIKTDDVQFCIVPSEGYNSTAGDATVWGKLDSGEFGELMRGTWKDVVKFFKLSKEEWQQHIASLPAPRFTVGMEVAMLGGYQPNGPTKAVVEKIGEGGVVILAGMDGRVFKRDGDEVDRSFSSRRRPQFRSRRIMPWAEYEATMKAEDDRRARQKEQVKLYNEANSALYLIPKNGSEESSEKLAAIVTFLNTLVKKTQAA